MISIEWAWVAAIITFAIGMGVLFFKKDGMGKGKMGGDSSGRETAAAILFLITGALLGATGWGQAVLGFFVDTFNVDPSLGAENVFVTVLLVALAMQTIRLVREKQDVQYLDLSSFILIGILIGMTSIGQWILALIFDISQEVAT